MPSKKGRKRNQPTSKNPSPSKNPSSSKKPPPTTTLSLRIEQSGVAEYTNTVTHIHTSADARRAHATSNPAPDTPGYLILLERELSQFERYSGDEKAQWLIDMAHGICDPFGKRGELRVWDGGVHRSVDGRDPLQANIYEYHIEFPVSLIKISLRNGKSMTSATGSPNAMADAVRRRDHGCWITGVDLLAKNSYVCPKRMGDEHASFIYGRYVGTPVPPNLSIYDPCFGICLYANLDGHFDMYQLGFKKFIENGQIKYRAHNFTPDNTDVNIVGNTRKIPGYPMPPLHGFVVTPPDHTSPPPGLLFWHYLQCVIRIFGHPMLKNSPNTVHLERPRPMEDDLEDEEDGFWPSAIGSMYKEHPEEKLQKHEATAQWVENCST
ncbi:hypothetical protein BDP27DRAFT_1396707, partial [Rhodocollybia butyracea]